LLVETVSREGLWRMQTPQIFRRERLLELILGAKARGETWTDEAGMVLQAGDAVGVVAAEGPNFKITLPPDLALAEAVLASRR
jgi:2-C-methyl-D-erythritol 4-phosphate cytidylyltransferase